VSGHHSEQEGSGPQARPFSRPPQGARDKAKDALCGRAAASIATQCCLLDTMGYPVQGFRVVETRQSGRARNHDRSGPAAARGEGYELESEEGDQPGGKRALSLLCAFTLAMAVVQFPVTLA